ncbi:MAG: hypothetical protein K2L23_02110 [Odoribacter sp.]|nr:hypothetical protein [Odoribacter sp.]
MKFSIDIEKFIGKSLLTTILVGMSQLLCAQSDAVKKNRHLENRNYISAFTGPTGICNTAVFTDIRDSICYTIQICSIGQEIHDVFFGGKNKIQILPMGDVYRYIFSMYPSLAAARKDLPIVRRIYPSAFIREFKAGKLGTAIDLNIEQIRINNEEL